MLGSSHVTRQIKTVLRRLDHARKRKMIAILNIFLSKIGSDYSEKQRLSVHEVKRIVIVRNNRRVGNTVFLLPFIHQVKRIYPQAEITLVLKNAKQQEIFQNLGITHFVFSELYCSRLWRFIRSLQNLRASSYDLCFMPFNSTHDALICVLLKAKNKIAFEHAHLNRAFTHLCPRAPRLSHMALQCLSLLPTSEESETSGAKHQMVFSSREQQLGLAAWQQIMGESQAGVSLAFFRGARGDKRLSDATWRTMLDKFEQSIGEVIHWVEIMGPELDKPLKANSKTFRCHHLRELACFLKNADGFISCDTGPLHLADAAEVTCIGLYTHTDPLVYGMLGKSCVCIDDATNFNALPIMERLMAQSRHVLWSQYVHTLIDSEPKTICHEAALAAMHIS